MNPFLLFIFAVSSRRCSSTQRHHPIADVVMCVLPHQCAAWCRYGTAIGLPRDFTMADRGEQSTMLTAALKELGPDGHAVTKDQCFDFLSAVKNKVRVQHDAVRLDNLALQRHIVGWHG